MPEVVDNVRRDLVVANRILAREGILDAFGHVSVRHPQDPGRFIMARARAPELVEDSDLLEFGMDGELLVETDKVPYLERYIHAGGYPMPARSLAISPNH